MHIFIGWIMNLLDESTETYIKYLNMAIEIQNKGLHLDKTVEHLAELIYISNNKHLKGLK